jgi:hypothetical protein
VYNANNSNNANNANTGGGYNTNTNQMAFNIERRSKTPNILQSIPYNNNNNNSSSGTNMASQQGAARSSANLTTLNHQYGGVSSNQPQHQYQQPLRSKTPTNDRLLFQHSHSLTTPNDYIYLNGQPAQQQQQQQQQSSTTNIQTPATVYTTTTASFSNGNRASSKLEPAVDIEHHIPIYDQTTSLQHQRALQQQQQQQQKYSNNQQTAYQPATRSKTPGPETIYFRNGPASQSMDTANYPPTSNRSKTPTADMYYPTTAKPSVRIVEPNGSSTSTASPQTADTMPPYDIDDLLMLVLNNDQASLITDVDGNYYLEMTIELARQETGFGFRIVGGEEENSQVSVGYIVNGGSAHVDGRLRSRDELIMIDNECVLGATHRRVVQLMTIAGLNRRVKLMIRRKLNFHQYKILLNAQQQQLKSRYISNLNNNGGGSSSSRGSMLATTTNGISPSLMTNTTYPYTVTLFRNSNEGFGFIIISTDHGPKGGPSIGKRVRF